MSTPLPPNQPYRPQPPFPPQFQPSPPPAPAKKRGPWIFSKPVLVIVALFIGVAIGTNSAGSAKPAATITQQVTTTATATTTVTKATVPPSCLIALADADAMIQIFQDVAFIVADEFDAVSKYDVARMQVDNAKIKAKTAEIQANPYAADSAACRAAK